MLKVKRPYFLSRPRRFGKTIPQSTLEAVLKGDRELFRGFMIYDSDYDWSFNPVISLSLSSLDIESLAALKTALVTRLMRLAKTEELALADGAPSDVFYSLILALYFKYGKKVSILIDEYDAPILNKIDKPDEANEIREALKSFYGVLQGLVKMEGFHLRNRCD